MDVGRSPYTVRARLYPDSDEVFDLVWYQCRPDAPVLPYPTAINSLYQERDRDDWLPTTVGEILGTAETYHETHQKQFALGTHQCGTAADFAGDGVIDLAPPFVEYRADDLPFCCGDVRFNPADGGLVLGGEAGFVYYAPIGASGGFVVGGQAGEEVYTNTTARGGVELGGAAGLVAYLPYPAAGGVELGGAAGLVAYLPYPSAGGLELGGAAGELLDLVAGAEGGVQLGGEAGFVPALPIAAEGGVQLGGEAGGTVSLPIAAEGGLSIGGAAGELLGLVAGAEGGVQLGGEAGEVFTPPTPTPGSSCATSGVVPLGTTAGATSGGFGVQDWWVVNSLASGTTYYIVTTGVGGLGPTFSTQYGSSCAGLNGFVPTLVHAGCYSFTIPTGANVYFTFTSGMGGPTAYTFNVSTTAC